MCHVCDNCNANLGRSVRKPLFGAACVANSFINLENL